MLQMMDLKFYARMSSVTLIPMKSHIDLTKSCSLSIPFGTGAPEAQSGLGSAPLLAPALSRTHHPFGAWGLQLAIGDLAPRCWGRCDVTQGLSSAATLPKGVPLPLAEPTWEEGGYLT